MTSLDFISWFIFFGLTGTTVWLVVTYMRPENVAIRKFEDAVKQKNFNEALRFCEEGLVRDPNSVKLLVNASAICIPLKAFEKTLEYCNRGLALAPDNVKLLCNRSAANNNLSRVLIDLGQYDEAKTLIRQYQSIQSHSQRI